MVSQMSELHQQIHVLRPLPTPQLPRCCQEVGGGQEFGCEGHFHPCANQGVDDRMNSGTPLVEFGRLEACWGTTQFGLMGLDVPMDRSVCVLL